MTSSTDPMAAASPPAASRAGHAGRDGAGLQSLLRMLVGQMVVVTRTSGDRVVGIVASPVEKDPLVLHLHAAQTMLPGEDDVGPFSPTLTIAGADIAEVDASGARVSAGEELAAVRHVSKAKGDFRTDTEISSMARSDGRALQRWDDVGDALEPVANGGLGASKPGSAGGWDQFAENEARFGIKSNYQETLYTTKLDRTAKDFKQRERDADRLAREILAQGAENVHVAEERNQRDAKEIDEEDRYGAVVRAPPPAAAPKPGPKNEALTVDFRQFVSAERERLVERKAELARKEKQNRLTDLKAWAQTFQLNTPAPPAAQTKPAPPAKEAAKPSTSKLSAAARTFNPAAAAFTPGGKPPVATQKAPAASTTTPAHPFFGTRVLKNTSGTPNVMDDFHGPKDRPMPAANSITAWWPYTGRPYRQQVAMLAVPPRPPPMAGVYPGRAPPPMRTNSTAGPGAGALPPHGAGSMDPHAYAMKYQQVGGQLRYPGQPPFLGADAIAPPGSPLMYGPMSPGLGGPGPYASQPVSFMPYPQSPRPSGPPTKRPPHGKRGHAPAARPPKAD